MALNEKRKYKTDEKRKRRISFLKGSRTTMNRYKSSVYRELRRKGNEKRKKTIVEV